MDKSKLIELVRQNPCLWDIDAKGFHQREVKEQKWQEIAEKMNLSCVEVKFTWTNLRESYRRELKRKCSTSSVKNNIIKWPYFKQLLFLSGINPDNSDTSDTMIQVCNKDYTSEENEYERDVCDDLNDQTLKRKVSEDDTNVASKQFKLNPNIGLEESNVLYTEDEDYCFVLSLLPFLRKVPEDRKLGVRMSIIGTIEQELEMLNSFSSDHLYAAQYEHDQ